MADRKPNSARRNSPSESPAPINSARINSAGKESAPRKTKGSDGTDLLCKVVAVAITASRQAAKKIREVKRSGQLMIQDKGGRVVNIKEENINADYVTEADTGAQTIIVQHLKAHFDDLQYRGEEDESLAQIDADPTLSIELNEEVMGIISKEIDNLKKARPDYAQITQSDLFVWIDPLDGTREFVRNADEFNEEVTVLIGIAYKGRPIAGVLTQPFFEKKDNDYRDATVWAICGMGVYHTRQRLYTTKPTGGSEEFVKYNTVAHRIVTSRSHKTELIARSLQAIPDSRLIYRGGCGFKVLLLLDNEADAYIYPSRGTKRWDSCAPEAIIRAMGGECTDVFNERYDYSNIDKKLHENTLGLVITLSNHSFYIKSLSNEMKQYVWEEALKPSREK